MRERRREVFAVIQSTYIMNSQSEKLKAENWELRLMKKPQF
jgi:hypothetical protein